MRKDSDLISVIVPVYNSEKYLNICVESILKQTYKNIEVILINDGSTDASLSICNKYKELDKRVIVINQKNNGVSAARNKGLEISNGNYISFIDSDDHIKPTYLEELHNAIIKNNADVVRCCAIFEDGNENHRIESISIKGKYKTDDLLAKHLSKFLTYNNNIGCYVWALLTKKEIAPKFNKNLSYMEDTVYYLQLMENAKTFYFLDSPLYYYVYNSAGLSKNYNNFLENIKKLLDSYKKIESIIKDNKIIDLSIIDDMRVTYFYACITQIKMYAKSAGYSKLSNKTNGFFNDNTINKYILKINKAKLNLNKKLLFFMYSHNLRFLFKSFIYIMAKIK